MMQEGPETRNCAEGIRGITQGFYRIAGRKLRNEESQAVDRRNEWVAAVDRLNQQIAWLTYADPNHAIVEVSERLTSSGRKELVATRLAAFLSPRDGESSALSRSREMWLVPFRQPVSSTSAEHTGEWI